ncbi:MAG: LysM peptidoglycan-binding domain-containing protein [Thermodesulfobacteriota bacterium]|nr:LysM peptidoglycan-binding domain-containing protein [Thermodesulfobacteriota bacterium]
MQMFKRLLLIVAVIFLSFGCAQPPPVGELENTRSVVAHAYAAGAAQHASGEYQLANSALQAAELQVKNKEYRRASLTLDLARRYSAEALKLTIARKKQLAAEQKENAEEKQLAALAKQRKLERQARLKEQQERKKREAIVPEPKKPAPIVVKKTPPIVKAPKLVDHVEVRAGENLAIIAARVEVYKDALLWPLIYKANRDQIKDPTAIFSGQTLLIPRDKSRDEVEAARQEARELNLFQPLN